MNRRNIWAVLIGAGLVLVGVWGAWVPHRAAALVLSGWDLAEFLKFLPGPTTTRELFYLPVWCVGIVLVVIANQPTTLPTVRLGLLLLALALMLAILPPYPHVFGGYQSAEFRWRFVLGVTGGLVVISLPFVARLGKSSGFPLAQASGLLLLLLALVGAAPAVWQFLRARAAIEAVYGAPLGWGWGLGLFLLGWVLVGVIGVRQLMQNIQPTAR